MVGWWRTLYTHKCLVRRVIDEYVGLACFFHLQGSGGQSEWWEGCVMGTVYTVDRSTHTTNQLKHVRVVVVGGIEYRSIDPPKNL